MLPATVGTPEGLYGRSEDDRPPAPPRVNDLAPHRRRLMRDLGLSGVRRGRHHHRGPSGDRPVDLLGRDYFTAGAETGGGSPTSTTSPHRRVLPGHGLQIAPSTTAPPSAARRPPAQCATDRPGTRYDGAWRPHGGPRALRGAQTVAQLPGEGGLDGRRCHAAKLNAARAPTGYRPPARRGGHHHLADSSSLGLGSGIQDFSAPAPNRLSLDFTYAPLERNGVHCLRLRGDDSITPGRRMAGTTEAGALDCGESTRSGPEPQNRLRRADHRSAFRRAPDVESCARGDFASTSC